MLHEWYQMQYPVILHGKTDVPHALDLEIINHDHLYCGSSSDMSSSKLKKFIGTALSVIQAFKYDWYL